MNTTPSALHTPSNQKDLYLYTRTLEFMYYRFKLLGDTDGDGAPLLFFPAQSSYQCSYHH